MGISILAAASMVIIDIAFFVIIALFILLGAFKGVSKTFSGLFLVITIILISIILMGITTEPALKLDFVEQLDSKIESAADGWGDVFTEPVYQDADGNYYIESGAKLSDTDGIKGKFANYLAEHFMTEETLGTSLAGMAASMLTTLTVAAALFILYCIALSIIKLIVKKATKGMHDSDSAIVKTIDRVLGGIINAALALVFILLVLAILKSINISSVNDFINDSTICSYFYNSNPISQVFEKIFGA